METLRILLVEDEPEVCQSFQQHADNLEYLDIIAYTNNSAEALKQICDLQPNVIILDLELHKGGGTGIDILTGIHSLCLQYPPFILVTTNNSSKTTLEYVRTLGADFILSKHQTNYTEQGVLHFLETMRKAILAGQSLSGTTFPDRMEDQEKRMLIRLKTELHLLGFNPKHLGYKYLIDTILLKTTAPETDTYLTLITKYKKTASSIERAMQNAINWTWAHSPIEDLLQFYPVRIRSDKGVPTLTEFVSYYADKLKNEY